MPFLKEEFFQDPSEKIIFTEIQNYIETYNKPPTTEAVEISLSNSNKLTESQFTDISEYIGKIKNDDDNDIEWLFDETEKFCKDKAIYNAILESIHIIDGKSKTQTRNNIPVILTDALAVSFDTSVGHDYIEDADERYDFYHRKETKISFDLEMFNVITGGGTPPKTLNIIMAGTGVGKSLFMCHHASNCLAQNQNVLYITCEMAEERIAERIDANLMNVTMDELKELPKTIYDKKVETLKNKFTGKLIIKEYPTATAGANHFRHLLEELKLKKNVIPDIIFIDYLNICASSRMKMGASVNSYTYIKSIAEELRGLAVEFNVPIFSATQTNRQGFKNTDVGLEDTSESFGLPATADLMVALIATEELDEQNQICVKQLKNRYNDVASDRKFVVGINRAKMKLYDIKKEDQVSLVQSNQSNTEGYGAEYGGKNFDSKFTSKNFDSWNI
jgi:replicative DNA helicase